MGQRQEIQTRQTIADFLRPYGIASLDDFHAVVGGHREYAREVYTGRKAISKRLALKIRDYTKGILSVDFLFGLGPGNGR